MLYLSETWSEQDKRQCFVIRVARGHCMANSTTSVKNKLLQLYLPEFTMAVVTIIIDMGTIRGGAHAAERRNATASLMKFMDGDTKQKHAQ